MLKHLIATSAYAMMEGLLPGYGPVMYAVLYAELSLMDHLLPR